MEIRVSPAKVRQFQQKIWGYYEAHGRDMPWRNTRNPYRIFVSEIMLQQTQVERVKEKYLLFLKSFPSFEVLAEASLPEVLRVWQGLGYNRRAAYLLRSAQIIVNEHDAKLPREEEMLITLPGIGRGTAGSVLAFAFNLPTVFIETNIRRVFIHEFFKDQKNITDEDIRELVRRTLVKDNPREWYYALMDYGSFLAKELEGNPNRVSLTYRKQATFKGSRREVRGIIIRLLLKRDMSVRDLIQQTEKDSDLVFQALRDLEKERIVQQKGELYVLSGE